ncbi:MAG: uroporphyrinogen decarboxylase family protein [Nitrosomonadaceae bacterium]
MKSIRKSLYDMVSEAHADNKRLIAPLVGFPGCNLTNTTIKVAQQNHGVHYRCVNALVELLQPDIAFILMDLSVEANALGLPVRFPVDQSSSVEYHPVDNLDELDSFFSINILQDARIQSYIQTVEMMSMGLDNEILNCAYVVGPVTLAGLLETAERVAMDSILDPDRLDVLCSFSTEIIEKYAHALINAGADIICILEPTASILGPREFRKFSGCYVNHIIESYKYANIETVYHTCGNTMHLIEEMASTGVSVLSLDAPENGVDMAKAAQLAPENVIIMGNINPTYVLNDGSVEVIKKNTTELMEQMRPYPNFILSTGCDLPPETPIENMKAFMQAGRDFK